MTATAELLDEEVFIAIKTNRVDRIRAQQLNEVLSPIRNTLRDLDHVLVRRAHRPEWDIRQLRQDRAQLTLILSPDYGTRAPGTIEPTAAALVSGVSDLHRKPELPPAFNAEVVERIEKLGSVQDVSEVTLAMVGDRRSVIDDQTRQNAARATEVSQTTFGTVHGVLDTMTARTKFQCQVYDRATRRSVRVKAASDDVEQRLRQMFGYDVEVWGELTRNAFGQPLTLIASEVHDRPVEPFVAAREILGLLELPPGKTSAELLAEVRRGL